LEEKVSSEDEPARRARSDDGNTTDLENDSIGNDVDENDGSGNHFSDDVID
jgi:hypothetical protein